MVRSFVDPIRFAQAARRCVLASNEFYAFSTWANTEPDRRYASRPSSHGYYAKAQQIVPLFGFAGGSGITPILSILKTDYGGRPKRALPLFMQTVIPMIMFREELDDLKNQYLGRLSVIHILEDDSQDIDLFHGRVDGDKCTALFQTLINIKQIDMAFICGPEPMMLAISEALKDHGLTKEQIRFELRAVIVVQKKAASLSVTDKGISGRVTLGGESRSLTIEPETSLLQAALDQNIDAPYACCAGVCSTCKAKIIEGEVEMVTNHALEDYEVEAGYVLTCQSYPVSEKIVWDYDQAGH